MSYKYTDLVKEFEDCPEISKILKEVKEQNLIDIETDELKAEIKGQAEKLYTMFEPYINNMENKIISLKSFTGYSKINNISIDSKTQDKKLDTLEYDENIAYQYKFSYTNIYCSDIIVTMNVHNQEQINTRIYLLEQFGTIITNVEKIESSKSIKKELKIIDDFIIMMKKYGKLSKEVTSFIEKEKIKYLYREKRREK
jgi:hypothetical protein